MPDAPSRRRRVVAAGLWLAVVALTVRFGVLAAMEGLAHGAESSRLRLRLAANLPGLALGATVAGLALALLLAASSRFARAGRAVLGVVATAALAAWWLGWIADDASRRVGLDTSRGLAASLVAAVLAALAVALGSRAAGRSASARAESSARATAAAGHAAAGGSRGVLGGWALPAGLLLALPLAGVALLGGVDRRMELRTVVEDLLAERTWETLAQRDDAPVAFGLLTPSLDFKLRGSDMPALIMPPPAEVTLSPRSADGSTRLRLRAGVDHGAFAGPEPVPPGVEVGFTVTVGGRLAARAWLPLVAVGSRPGTEWIELGGDDGLPLPAGAEIVLRTRLRVPDGIDAMSLAPIRAGFGGPRVERSTFAPRTSSSPERPNVVLIVMDTQRRDRLSAYGYGRPTSPNLERLAARGTQFENAYATSSWTWPSTASLLTGLLPQEHGVVDTARSYLAHDLDTLPEALQAAGLSTAAWSANVLIVPDKNFDQGFETFDHPRGTTRRSATFMPAVLEWIESMGDTRFFLYLQLLDPHAPLIPLPEGRARFAPDVPDDLSPYLINDFNRRLLRREGHDAEGHPIPGRVASAEQRRWLDELYDACTWSGDHWLGEVLDTLQRAGLDDRTVVVFTADHGEELFDHGLVTHGQSLHDELVRVPLVAAGPGWPAGRRVAEPVSNRQLAPTLAAQAGARPVGAEDALDLREAAARGRLAPRAVLFSTRKGWWNGRTGMTIFGLRVGDVVLHWAPEGGPWGAARPAGPAGQWRLYDRAADPGETTDLSARRPEQAAALRRQLRARLDALAVRRDAADLPRGAATLELLQAIGYLDRDDGADGDR